MNSLRHPSAVHAVLVALLTGALGGCGARSQPALSSSAAIALDAQLASVRTAATAHDRNAALRALSRFSSLVRANARAGELTAGELTSLETGIAQTRRRILLEVAALGASATTPTTTTAPPVQSTAPAPVPKPAKPAKPKPVKSKRVKPAKPPKAAKDSQKP